MSLHKNEVKEPSGLSDSNLSNKKTLNITKHIVFFALPIILGNLLQQFYQIFASIVVGRTCGENSLAALGVATPIVSLTLFFMIGIGYGLTVLLSKYFGENNLIKFREIAFTARRAGIIFSIIFAILAILLTGTILSITKTPEVIEAETRYYLWIIFLGIPFSFMYNYFSATFLSIGRSKLPFCALCVSSGVNVALVLLLVGFLGKGIIGAAIANVAAQGSSVLFCVLYTRYRIPLLVLRTESSAKTDADWQAHPLRFHSDYIKEIVAYSIASAIQQIIFIIGRLIIQSDVNTLGVSVIAGYNAAANLESLVIAPADGISAALASLIAVEYGKKHLDGIKNIARGGAKLCVTYSVLLALSLWFLSPYLVPLFLKYSSPLMVSTGVTYLRWMFFAYSIISIPEVFQAFFRGTGQVKITIIATIIQIAMRVACTKFLLGLIGIKAVSLSTFFGWLLMGIYLFITSRKWMKSLSERG